MSSAEKAIIFCAPSGAGKTTIVRHLTHLIPALKFSVSATTRASRAHEKEARDYYFLSVEEFKSKITANDFYEWQEVYQDLFYGTLRAEVERIWASGNHVIFDVDVLGGINLKKALGDSALAVFVSVKDISILEQRLKARQTESSEAVKMRVEKAKVEIEAADQFDYILLNDNLETALLEAEKIVINFLNRG